MRILLIRHGQSEADLLDVHEGRADFPLTDLGHVQADCLAKWIKDNYAPSLIWSSPLKRAMQTAEHVHAYTTGDIRTHDGLMEFNNGVLAGMSRLEAAIQFPKPHGIRKPHMKIPGGESEIEFRARVESATSEIMSASESHHSIVMMSHGGTISRILQCLLRLPVNCGVHFTTGDTGVHCIETRDDHVVIRYTNTMSHLHS